MRRLLTGLLFLPCVTVAGAESIPLVLDPVVPRAFEPVTLTAASPVNEQGHAMIEVGVSNLWEDVVDMHRGVIHVSSYSRPRPPGSLVQPASEPFRRTIELGMLAPGEYAVEFDLFGANDLLLGSGSTTAMVAPEPSGAVIAALAAGIGASLRRRTRR